MENVDIAIVGAGVVGLAVAARVSRENRTVVVLESHPRYGVETSSRNSEVVHGGLYYPPESLKARLCIEGRERIYALAQEAGIYTRRCGKFVVAEDASRVRELEAVFQRATASGAEGLRMLEGREACRQVPGIRAFAALWSPNTGIVDTEDFMRHLYAKASDRGAVFLFKNPLLRAEASRNGHALFFGSQGESLKARVVVNAAGLFSDKVAAMAGVDPEAAGYRLHWCKGSYFRCRKRLQADRLIYPAPSKYGLGIHMTIDRRGGVRFGPDTEFVDALNYDVDPALAGKFHAAIRSYWPSVEFEDLFPDTSGIRPKLSGPEGGFRDFVIAEESARGLPGWINLVGIDSPGLTSSLAIAEEVAKLMAPYCA